MRLLRVLVVNDFQPFRQFFSSHLKHRRDLQVICEASDGIEAVQKAEELQPHLVLLDIGLPDLNGIEAAQRIRKVSPSSKILFVSQESSVEIVHSALQTGGTGYILKADAGGELMAAVEAVLRGKTFISSSIATVGSAVASENVFAPSELVPIEREASAARSSHEVRIYSDDAVFLDDFAAFIGAALMAGNTVIFLGTNSHCDGILPRLLARGSDVAAAIQHDRYVCVDAASTLAKLMVKGRPDSSQFFEVAGELITTAIKGTDGKPSRIVACGECAGLLWEEGKQEAALQLERLWNEVINLCALDVVCAYQRSVVEKATQISEKMCAEHSTVYSF